MNRFVLLAVPAAMLFAAPAFAQVMTPAEYVMTAGASDLFERESAKLVLETTYNPGVKMFATMMLTAHAQSTAEVKAAAMKSGVPAKAPTLTRLQTEMIAELTTANGPDRDGVYIAQQRAAHGVALSVQQAYAMDGTAPALKSAASDIVPVVQHHIALLMKM